MIRVLPILFLLAGCASTTVVYDQKTDYLIIKQQTFLRRAEIVVNDKNVDVKHKEISTSFANVLSGAIGFLLSKIGIPF